MASFETRRAANGAKVDGAPVDGARVYGDQVGEVLFSLFEGLWSEEASPEWDSPALLFLDLAPENPTARQRRLQRLESNLTEISRKWRRDEECAKKEIETTTTAEATMLSSVNNDPSVLFRFCVLSLYRLTHTCPFGDVAAFCRRLLASFVASTPKSVVDAATEDSLLLAGVVEGCKTRCDANRAKRPNPSISVTTSSSSLSAHDAFTVSAFIPSSELISLPDDESPDSDPPSDSYSSTSTAVSLFRFRFISGVGRGAPSAAASLSRVENLCRLLACHPSYLEALFRTEDELMASVNNPLVADQSRFLAVLASAHQICSSLVFLESQKFLLSGGDPRWLNDGLGIISSSTRNGDNDDVDHSSSFSNSHAKLAKFRAMADFNQLLLHRPWAVNAANVASLVKPSSTSSAASTACWTIPEVVHAIAILAHFHGVACIIHGCGVVAEIDDVLGVSRGGGGGGGEGDSFSSSLALPVDEDVDQVGQVIDKMRSIDALTGPEMDEDQKARVFQRLAEEEPEIVVEAELGVEADAVSTVQQPGSPGLAREHQGSANLPKSLKFISNDDEESSRKSPSVTSIETSAIISTSPVTHDSVLPSAQSTVEATTHLLHVSLSAPTSFPNRMGNGKNKFAKFFNETNLKFIDFSSSRNRARPGLAAPSTSPTTLTTFSSLQTSSSPPSPTKKSPPSGSTRKSQKYEPLRLDEFSWQDHGYSIMSRFCEFSSLFDDKFEVTRNLTYFTMGQRDDIDTTTFRVAVWNYVQLIYGIRHDDYDYRELSIMLDLPLRKFIKAVSCYPSRVTKELFDCCMTNFKPSEKIHVTVMIAEAKIQAQLLYALRAVDEYLK